MKSNASTPRVLFNVVLGLEYALLLSLPTIVIYYALSPTITFQFPPDKLTLSWFSNLLSEPRLMTAMRTSLLVAAVSTLSALALGIPAAIALVRGRFRGRGLVSALVLSPISFPGIVLALGLLMFLSRWLQPRLGFPVASGLVPLVLAHLIVTTPWVVRTVSAGLQTLDPDLEDAARGLGASPWKCFLRVTLPLLKGAVAAGATFAFIVSFGNFSLSLFFASGTNVTLPVAIFEYVDRFQDPTIAAASSLVILVTLILISLADWAGGLSTATETRQAVATKGSTSR